MSDESNHIDRVDTVVGSNFVPDEMKPLLEGRKKKRLGDTVGISQFGVNHTVLEPGAISAMKHWHEGEDEFIYVLEGTLTLVAGNEESTLKPGWFAGFPANRAIGHHIVNNSDTTACFIEIGSRRPGKDRVHYPDNDIGPIER